MTTQTSPRGHAPVVAPVAPNPALSGTVFHGQWFVVDPGGASFGSASASHPMFFRLGLM